jgi:hypothetical protein
MSQVATSFADSIYSASNKPNTTTLKADIQALETALNDTDSTAVKLTGSQTLTDKVLTSPVINAQITGTAIVDEDNMASDSAVKVPTQQSVKAYVLSIASVLNPIGTIREFNVATNPGTLLGFGTWSAYGTGKVTVAIDSGDTDFDTVDETGGAKTVAHVHSGPSHTHTGTTSGPTGTADKTDSGGAADTANQVHTHTFTSDAGGTGNTGSTSPSVVQPYIVVYRWVRTA